jgi:hypothetical protein
LFPSQLLLIEVLRRPVESTQYWPLSDAEKRDILNNGIFEKKGGPEWVRKEDTHNGSIHMKFRHAYILAILLLLPIIVACENTVSNNNKNINEASKGNIDNTFDRMGKPLTFKGLYLGMTLSELKDKSKNKIIPWEFSIKDRIDYIDYNGNEDWIGYEGEGDQIKYYRMHFSYIDWYNDRIIGINIASKSVNADYIDTYIKEWMRFAANELERKFGRPTKIIIPANKLSILDFKSHFSAYCYKWERRNERITVSAVEGDSTYSCMISFEDVEGIHNMEINKKKNPTSSF